MDTLNIVSTGTLNYHLKVLGDLLTKDDVGRYALTEKGQVAVRVLKLYPAENDAQLRKRRQKWFWIASGVSQVVYFAVAVALYYFELVNVDILIQSTVWFFGQFSLSLFGF
jgi:hypothetical protein